MDTITIFEDNLKTVTVVHADKELIFKLFIFSWSIIRVIKSMFHEFDNNNFVLNNNIWIWPISLTNQDNPLFYNEKEGLNNTLQLFIFFLHYSLVSNHVEEKTLYFKTDGEINLIQKFYASNGGL